MSATSNGTVENGVDAIDKKGWLLKRTHFTYRWKLAWFELKDSMLVYGDNEKVRWWIRYDQVMTFKARLLKDREIINRAMSWLV